MVRGMRIAERQQRYGFILGVLAFILGWGILYLLAPSLELEGVDRWMEVTWTYLSAHYITIAGIQVSGASGFGTSVDLIRMLNIPVARAIPPLVIALAGIFANDIIGYTTRFSHLAKNTASVLTGYGLALLLAYLQSMANPGIALAVTAVFIGFVALYLGSTLVGLVGGIPIFGVASLGTLAAIGLIVIFAGISLLIALFPALVVMVGTVAVTSVMIYLARNAPT